MLNEKESAIMDVLWENGKPMLISEIVRAIPQKVWGKSKDRNIHRQINALIDKDLLRVNGHTLTGKLYARMFEPTMTREEYTIKVYSKKTGMETLLQKWLLVWLKQQTRMGN